MIKDLNKYRSNGGYLNIPELNIYLNGTISDNYISLYCTAKIINMVKTLVPRSVINIIKEQGNIKSIRSMYTIEDSDYFCKAPTGIRPYNPIMESLASIIGNYLGGDYLDYDIIEAAGKPLASISKSFLPVGSTFETVSEMLPKARKQFTELNLEELLELLKLLGVDELNIKMTVYKILKGLIIDTLLQQFDRHTLNLGFIHEADGLVLSPFFDNEYWFPNSVSIIDIRKYCNSEETFSAIKYYAFLRKIKNYYQANLFGYSIYDFVIAILKGKIDELNVPLEIKEIISSISVDFINNILFFNPFSLLDSVEYQEVRNNEIYGFLVKQGQREFIKELELKDKQK